MKTLRTVVVGLGRIGYRTHVPRTHEHPGFELAAVVDPLRERLDEVHSEYGTPGYTDLAECLDAEKPDLVTIASPTLFHTDQAILAFERGCDVFTDKPMAPSLAEADRMIDGMKRTGRKLMVYQPRRADADIVALETILERNLLGPLYMIKATRSRYTRRHDWQAFVKNGGGMLNNYGAHVIDQGLYLTDGKAKYISCSLRTIAALGDADDVVKAVIESESGILIDVDINMATAHEMQPWHILGKYGSAVMVDGVWNVKYYDPDQLEDVAIQDALAAPGRSYTSGEVIPWQETTVNVSDYQPVNYYDRCHEYFAQDKAPYVSIDQSRELMRVLEECRKDAAR